MPKEQVDLRLAPVEPLSIIGSKRPKPGIRFAPHRYTCPVLPHAPQRWTAGRSGATHRRPPERLATALVPGEGATGLASCTSKGCLTILVAMVVK